LYAIVIEVELSHLCSTDDCEQTPSQIQQHRLHANAPHTSTRCNNQI